MCTTGENGTTKKKFENIPRSVTAACKTTALGLSSSKLASSSRYEASLHYALHWKITSVALRMQNHSCKSRVRWSRLKYHIIRCYQHDNVPIAPPPPPRIPPLIYVHTLVELPSLHQMNGHVMFTSGWVRKIRNLH